MVNDQSGRAWVDKVSFVGSEVTEYGVAREYLPTSITTSKPFDYTNQWLHLQGLKLPDGRDASRVVDPLYSDITPFLSSLPPIKAFMEALEITPPALQ
jgi:hypothetical protein